MKQTANTKPSWLHLILAAEFDRASALFCMQWAIEDGDFDLAMYHQMDYIFHSDKYKHLYAKMTKKQMSVYWDFHITAMGVL